MRRGLLGPVERAGLFPARYYLALALDALGAEDLDAAVEALEACARGHGAARRRAAAARAWARADYLEQLAAEAATAGALARLEARLTALRDELTPPPEPVVLPRESYRTVDRRGPA